MIPPLSCPRGQQAETTTLHAANSLRFVQLLQEVGMQLPVFPRRGTSRSHDDSEASASLAAGGDQAAETPNRTPGSCKAKRTGRDVPVDPGPRRRLPNFVPGGSDQPDVAGVSALPAARAAGNKNAAEGKTMVSVTGPAMRIQDGTSKRTDCIAQLDTNRRSGNAMSQPATSGKNGSQPALSTVNGGGEIEGPEATATSRSSAELSATIDEATASEVPPSANLPTIFSLPVSSEQGSTVRSSNAVRTPSPTTRAVAATTDVSAVGQSTEATPSSHAPKAEMKPAFSPASAERVQNVSSFPAVLHETVGNTAGHAAPHSQEQSGDGRVSDPSNSTYELHTASRENSHPVGDAPTEVRVNLRTEELGKVEIRTSLHANHVSAAVSVEDGIVRNALSAEFSKLPSTLGVHDLHFDGISVSIAQENGRPSTNSDGGQQRHSQEQPRHLPIPPASATTNTEGESFVTDGNLHLIA